MIRPRTPGPAAAVAALLVVAVLLAVSPPAAFAHAAFLGSAPAPGARLGAPPGSIAMRFTEAINRRLSTAALYSVTTGRQLRVRVGAPTARQLVLRPLDRMGRGAYRVEWHSVSADDGHALEGSFSFGVQAAAVGGARSTQAGALAGGGWLRVLVRALLYPALFVFAGGALLAALLGRRRSAAWLMPAQVARELDAAGAARIARRGEAVVVDAGLLAMPLALASALLDTANAAGGLSGRAVRDYLLAGSAGLGRLALVAFLAVGVVAVRRGPYAAAAAGALALGALAIAGHAASAPQPRLAVLTDWLHLLAAAAWLGGIAVLVLTWLPALRGQGLVVRRAVMRHVLARFGRVALPAFAVVVVTGGLNALIELPRVAALWQTAYGRVLLIKIALVGLIALASYTHAMRLRPRLLVANPHPDLRLERRHWRLLGAEPLLGAGVALAVAFLVGFPLPRQTARAQPPPAASAACNPCPQPTPRPDELSVAEQGGSNLVAAWVRRRPSGLSGEVRLLDARGDPSSTPFEIEAAKSVSVSCGPACRRFRIPSLPRTLRVNVVERGHEYAAVLPTIWRANQSRRARRLLERAQAAMRRLRTVREEERVQSVPGLTAITSYALQAPDRFAYTGWLLKAPARRPKLQARSITIGKTQWTQAPSLGWQKGQFGGGLPFRTRSWFDWTSYATAVRLLTITPEHGRPTAVLALADPGTPAWWRLWVDLRTLRVTHSRLITTAHYMSQRFFAFNRPLRIRAPSRTR